MSDTRISNTQVMHVTTPRLIHESVVPQQKPPILPPKPDSGMYV